MTMIKDFLWHRFSPVQFLRLAKSTADTSLEKMDGRDVQRQVINVLQALAAGSAPLNAGPSLEIRASLVCKGRGVFAQRRIPRGDFVAFYPGLRYSVMDPILLPSNIVSDFKEKAAHS